MTSEDVILIIDEICEKCGIAVSSIGEIVPAFATYEIAGDLSLVIITIILGAVILIPSYLLWKKEETEYKESHLNSRFKFEIFDDGSGLLVFLFILNIVYLVTGIICLIITIPSLLQWAISPEAAFIAYILNMI